MFCIRFSVIIFLTTLVLDKSIVKARSNGVKESTSKRGTLILQNGTTVFRRQCSYSEGIALVGLSTVEILKLYGHEPETHYVTAEDGYIFQVHRIPAEGKPVVYVLPGIVQSSRDLLLNCEGRSLASKLIKAGYDVWLGNFRGNLYGRNHSKISTKSPQFWRTTWDEMFKYDGPAAVDYVLRVSGQDKLNWVGFSLGTSVMLGMLSLFPEYNDKINVAALMAPGIHFGHTKSLPFRGVRRYHRALESLVFFLYRGEFPSPNLFSWWQRVAPKVCRMESSLDVPSICSYFVELIDSRDVQQVNLQYLPALVSGSPSPFPIRVLAHGGQLARSGRFQKFDYGTQRNIELYGSSKPPSYNLSSVRVPILVMWGENDNFITKEDVRLAVKDLPSIVEDRRVDWDSWNHLDFLYGKDADVLVYDYVIKFLAKFNN